MIHKELTEKIIGCAMQVHNTLGNGFQEVNLSTRPGNRNESCRNSFRKRKPMDIFYRDQNIGSRRVDFFVEKLIMVELKAIIQLEDVNLAQACNYLEA